MYLEIDEGYEGHRKTLRLCAIMRDPQADIYPIRLWRWACRSAPDGDLTGMEAGEIELAVRYPALDGRLYEALVKAGFIDDDPSAKRIHNWMQRTGGAIAKMEGKAAKVRVFRAHKKKECDPETCPHCAEERENCSGTDPEQCENAASTTPARSGDVPHRQDQSSQDQSRPDKSRPGDPDAPARVAIAAPPPSDFNDSTQPGDSRETAAPEVMPDSPSNLLHVLGREVSDKHPELGLYSPGRFADRDATDFYRRIPDNARAKATKLILERIRIFASLPNDDGWSLRSFLDAFNALGARPPPADRPPPIRVPANWPRSPQLGPPKDRRDTPPDPIAKPSTAP